MLGKGGRILQCNRAENRVLTCLFTFLHFTMNCVYSVWLLQSVGSQRVGHDCATELTDYIESLYVHIFFFIFLTVVDNLKSESEIEVAQSCPTLCDPVNCRLPGFSIHGILQARILEWVTISFSRGSSQPRDRTQVSLIGGRRFNL